MPASESYTVGEILDDLEGDMDDVAAAADEAAAEDEAEDEQGYVQVGLTLEQRAAAIDNIAEQYGRDARIEIQELSAGDRVEYGELLAAATRQWEERQGVDAEGGDLRGLYWVAAGVTAAPWLDGDETLQERAVALRSDGPPAWPAIQHLKGLVTEVNSLASGNVQPFSERRGESQTTAQPTNRPE